MRKSEEPLFGVRDANVPHQLDGPLLRLIFSEGLGAALEYRDKKFEDTTDK